MKTFKSAIQSGRLALTAELTIKREYTADDVLREARRLSEQVDAVQVTDNPYGWAQISAVAAASILLHNGIDAIPILTCRDRNRIALKSDLLGLRALGVSSILLTRGHQVPQDHEIQTMAVFDTTGRELMAMAEEIRLDTDFGPKREFFIGTGARAFRPKRSWQAESLKSRAAAGAQFMQTQLCFNMDILRRYMHMLVELKLTWDYSVMVSLAVLPSAETARWIKQNMADSLVPKALIERLEGAADPKHEGIQICAELMQEIAKIPGVSGINLMTVGDSDSIVEAIEASGLAGKKLQEDTDSAS
ncbi:MAG: methylenetetrahydrofolate reductase (NADPH) [Lysobacterales bacterium]